MDRPIVVNASPLIFLGNASHLELLRSLQGTRILVPEVVHAEVSSGGHFDRAVRELSAATWIERAPDVDVSTRVLEWDLGGGEASVIELALRTPGAEVVIDDLAGRRCALAMGLRVHGTLGVVIESYRLGKLTDPRATMLELRANGMWISDAVIERALQIAMRHE